MRRTKSTKRIPLARECAQVAKEMHDAGSQCVHLRDVALKIFGKQAHVKSGAYRDVLGCRKKTLEILEKSLKCYVAFAIQKYEDNGFPIITDLDMARQYIPQSAGKKNGGGVILVFASIESLFYPAYVHINKQHGNQKSVSGDNRLCSGHTAGVISDEAAIDVKARSNAALELGKIPQIERTVICRKCSKEVTYSVALKERWFFFKVTDRWSCRSCHTKTMLITRSADAAADARWMQLRS